LGPCRVVVPYNDGSGDIIFLGFFKNRARGSDRETDGMKRPPMVMRVQIRGEEAEELARRIKEDPPVGIEGNLLYR
jgi:hypothetical protein